MKIIALSDTHSFHDNYRVPEGDVFVFAGDMSNWGKMEETIAFSAWIKALPHKYKCIIFGNHDIFSSNNLGISRGFFEGDGIHLLVDEGVWIDGVFFYGTPWVQVCGNWGWQKHSGELKEVWKKIPLDTDVLITHSPPYVILDRVWGNEHIGCRHLKERVEIVKPKIHIFGHCHEQAGRDFFDGATRYYNVASKISCTEIEI